MPTIIECVRNDSTLTTLAGLLEKAGLATLLGEAGGYTLFAPNDAAFLRMDIGKTLEDPKELMETLKYHLISKKLTAAEIGTSDSIDTEYYKPLTVVLEEGEPMIDNAKFVTTDIECSNGVIQIIDNVFKPKLSGWYRDE
ncbi:MAG: fasciclin domain-containing protein [Desulfuromonadales bacterium]|nr:fasciclin domain-containing protein [Desulfuromonadales bacterium]